MHIYIYVLVLTHLIDIHIYILVYTHTYLPTGAMEGRALLMIPRVEGGASLDQERDNLEVAGLAALDFGVCFGVLFVGFEGGGSMMGSRWEITYPSTMHIHIHMHTPTPRMHPPTIHIRMHMHTPTTPPPRTTPGAAPRCPWRCGHQDPPAFLAPAMEWESHSWARSSKCWGRSCVVCEPPR